MLITRPGIPESEITDERFYLRRREFIQLAGGVAAAAASGALLSGRGGTVEAAGQVALANYKPKVVSTDEKLNSFEEITGYNNFYDFGSGKNDPQRYAGKLTTSPWTVKIDGLCNKPADYLLEDLIKPYQLEERIYRMRCVEAWSMVIPWNGFPLAEVIKRAEPQPKATFVAFTTLLRPNEMIGQREPALEWPHRGAADGRGDAPADDPLGQFLRQDPDEPERRAPAASLLEIRFRASNPSSASGS